MPNDSPTEGAGRRPEARSRITNGSQLLPQIDGRSLWARRMRDLMDLHLQDLGGPDNTSEAERSIVRRAAVISVELEYQEMRFAELRLAGQAPTDAQLELYGRMAGHLRRLLQDIGLERRAKDVTPDLRDYLQGKRSDG